MRRLALALLLAATACRTPIAFDLSASQVESLNPDRPVVKAVGEGGDENEAMQNCERSAAYAVARDLAQAPEERGAFESWAQQYLRRADHPAHQLIDGPVQLKRRVINAAGNVEIVGLVTVNRDAIQRLLLQERIIADAAEDATLQNPTFAVLPDKDTVEQGFTGQASSLVQGYLGSKGFEVSVVQASAEIDLKMVLEAMRDGAGQSAESDNEILDVLAADAFVVYSVRPDKDAKRDDKNAIANVSIRVFETATGLLLGEADGRSAHYTGAGSLDAAVKEALRDAIDLAIPKVTQTWKKYAKTGVPYTVLVRGELGSEAGLRGVSATRRVLQSLSEKIVDRAAGASAVHLSVYSRRSVGELRGALEGALRGQGTVTQKGKLIVVGVGGAL